MKTLAFLFKTVPVIFISIIFLGCDILKGDRCDLTKAPEISVSINVIVRVRGKNNLPMKDQRIKVWIYKEPCGAPAKGEFTFEGVTDAEGNFYTTEANYYLRNKEDKISVDALGSDIVVGGISNTNGDNVSVMYEDFIVGTIKNVDNTLLTNQ
jgi:hypothetical protein